MSKIKDLYAEVNDIDDLKPEKSVYNKAFYDAVREDDIKRISQQVFESRSKVMNIFDWFYDKAEFGCGYDDEGHKEIYFENFTELCDKAAMDLMDWYIEDNALDIDDDMYDRITNMVGDMLADAYADTESEVIRQYLEDVHEVYERQAEYDRLTLPRN